MHHQSLKFFLLFSIILHITIFIFLIFSQNQTKYLIIENNDNNFAFIEIDMSNDLANYNETDFNDYIYYEYDNDLFDQYEQEIMNIIDNAEHDDELLPYSKDENQLKVSHDNSAKKIEKFSLKAIKKENLLINKANTSNINLQINSIKNKKLAHLIKNNIESCWNAPMILNESDNIMLNFHLKLNKEGKIIDIILSNKNKLTAHNLKKIQKNFNRTLIKCMPTEELKYFDHQLWKKIDLTLKSKLKNI